MSRHYNTCSPLSQYISLNIFYRFFFNLILKMMKLCVFVLLVSFVLGGVEDAVGYIFSSSGTSLETYTSEFLPLIGFEAPTSYSYVSSSDEQDLNNEIAKLAKSNKRVIFGYLPQFKPDIINEIAKNNSVIFITPAVSTDDGCYNSLIQGYSICRSISRILELIKHDYKSFTILYDTQSNLKNCADVIYEFLKHNSYSNPLVKEVITPSDINVASLTADDVILNFLSTAFSNNLYDITPRTFNIIGFQNIDIQQIPDLTKLENTYVASESNDDCGSLNYVTTTYPTPSIEQFSLYKYINSINYYLLYIYIEVNYYFCF